MLFGTWVLKAVRVRLYPQLLSYNVNFLPATAKAFQTSAQPGLTQALSTRLKVSLDPLVYAFDTPGIMLPFLGRGVEGAERGVKLALIGT
jgi:mitochondrial GTPase 1